MEVYGQLLLTFYVGELRCRGKATRNGPQEKCRAAFDDVCEQPQCQDKTSRRRGGFDELSRRATACANQGHQDASVVAKIGHEAVALSRRLGGTRCPRRKYTKALAVTSFAMFPLACPW